MDTPIQYEPAAEPPLGDLVIARDFVALIEGSRFVNAVRRADVEMIYVRYGLQARHPLLMLAVGVMLLLASLLGLAAFTGIMAGLRGLPRGIAYMAANIIVAPYCLREGARRGYFLDIQTPRGIVRLASGNYDWEKADIETICRRAEDLGYNILRDANLPAED